METALGIKEWYIEAKKFVKNYISKNHFRADALSEADYMGILTHNDPDKEMMVYSSRALKNLIKDACDKDMWLTVHRLSSGFCSYPDFVGDENYWIVDINNVYTKNGPVVLTLATIKRLREDVINELGS